MKQHTKSKKWEAEEGLVIGLDLGDQKSQVCVYGADIGVVGLVAEWSPRLRAGAKLARWGLVGLVADR